MHKTKLTSYIYDFYSTTAYWAKYKAIHVGGIKVLTLKQMLKRLPIALAQVKADNTSGNLLNEIRQIIYTVY